MLETADREIRLDRALRDLTRALALARIRCRSTPAIVRSLYRALRGSDRDAVLFVLRERRLSQHEQTKLADALRNLAERSAGLPSGERGKLDSAVRQLIRVLSPRVAAPLAESFLDSKWKSRRLIAYSGFRVGGVTPSVAGRLLARYRETGDQGLLELIVRTPKVAARMEPRYLLEALSEHYWRARLMESLIRYHRSAAFELAVDYPSEFAHAAGRAQDATCVPVLKQLLRTAQDPEFLPLCAFAFGRLRAERELRKLSALVNGRTRRAVSAPSDSGSIP